MLSRSHLRRLLATATVVAGLTSAGANPAAAQRCGQPASTGDNPTATDCLFILRVAVGAVSCAPSCVCDVNGSLTTTASDALTCLNIAVGADLPKLCPCDSATTTTSIDPPDTTTTTTLASATTTTTLPPPTTTTTTQPPATTTTTTLPGDLGNCCVSLFGLSCRQETPDTCQAATAVGGTYIGGESCMADPVGVCASVFSGACCTAGGGCYRSSEEACEGTWEARLLCSAACQ